MIDPAAFAQSFIPKPEAVEGLINGTLTRIGSVIYNVGGGIHSHMQETAGFDPIKLSAQVTEVSGQIGNVSQGVQLVKALQLANVALTAVDIGVSVAGFAIMNAKLNAVRNDIQYVAHTLGLMRDEKFDEDFLMLSTFLERFEEAWFWRNLSKAEDEWRSIGTEARRFQDLFDHRAKKLLQKSEPDYALGDRMIDALSMIGGLRMSAAMAANEAELARKIADQCAHQIVALTGDIGLVELVRPGLPSGIAPGSTDWPKVMTKANAAAQPLVAKFREREACAITRSAPLPLLEARGITPHQWLRIAREETKEPLLMLSVN